MIFPSSLLAAFLVVAGTADAQQYIRTDVKTGPAGGRVSPQYTCEFINLWTPERHSEDYPPVFPHWSPPTAIAHDESVVLFEEGEKVTPGVQSVAETGSRSTLNRELESNPSVFDSAAGGLISGNDFNAKTTISNLQFEFNHPYLSLITMIAPSPDWFSGISGYSMLNKRRNLWYDRISLDVFPWSAGTDAGTTYEAADVPRGSNAIGARQFTPQNTNGNIFVSPDGIVLPVGRIMCTRVGASPPRRKFEPISGKCRRSRQCTRDNFCNKRGPANTRGCSPCMIPGQTCRFDRQCCRNHVCRDDKCVRE